MSKDPPGRCRNFERCRNVVVGTALFCASCISPAVTVVHSHPGIAISALYRSYGAGQSDMPHDPIPPTFDPLPQAEYGGGTISAFDWRGPYPGGL